jgi:hypothetical protein
VARIMVGTYMVRYPLGGMISWGLQYVLGLKQLGHEVYVVEKSGWENSCYDPSRRVMTNDCSYGTRTVSALLGRFELERHWCFVDAMGEYHGLGREDIEAVFRSADVFVDIGTHGAWLDEAAHTTVRVLVEGEPGFTQMKMEKKLRSGQELQGYDFYFSNGMNVGTEKSTASTAGLQWHTVFNPVVLDLFGYCRSPAGGRFTTVMNWETHEPIEFEGRTYGLKDKEFLKFVNLPRLVDVPCEIAVAGKAPVELLAKAGWGIRNAHEVTESFDSFREYVRASRAEFTVCKGAYVETNSGWFSDRSAAYLASGRPVVIQDTGFRTHLPCGEGLFAVDTVDEAAAAIEEIEGDYERHSRRAFDIAVEYLDARKVLRGFLGELGI